MDRAILKAEQAIAKDDPVIYDVAAQTGAMVDNVKHMRWFVLAVAEAITEAP